MRALIAHRRLATSPDGTQQYELAIGARGFACFNGFNEPTAFTKKADPEEIRMVTDLQGNFANRAQDWLPTAATWRSFATGKTLGEWECVAIGWIYNGAHAGQPPTHNRQLPATSHAYDFTIGNALRREGFMGRYYDAWHGGYKTSIRRLTPMELYLTRVFQHFESEDRREVPSTIRSQSAFAQAVNDNNSSAGCLYQFVGSERPSGQAVAFLQTFRNVSEVQYSGWTGANAIKYNILVAACQQVVVSTNESAYPLLDHMVNYGTDNAITCYAGTGVMLHGMRYGFWTLEEFFQRRDSMVIEGRYNKGAQSSNLSSNYRRRAEQARVTIDPNATTHFESLRTSGVQAPAEVSPMVSFDRIGRAAAQGTLDRFIEGVVTAIRNVARADMTATVTRLWEVVRRHADARTPVAPPAPVAAPVPPPAPPVTAGAPPARPTQEAALSATPRNTTAGAAVGFTQWTSAAVH